MPGEGPEDYLGALLSAQICDQTLAAIHATGSPGRFVGWATPLMRRQIEKSISADLRRLRDCLEDHAA